MSALNEEGARAAGWAAPPEHPRLDGEEVHVWRASLARPDDELGAFLDILSEDERGRAGRFHFRRDRVWFIAARGILRQILGRYLGTPPRLVRFDYNAYGKPRLRGAEGETRLRFNLSHAGGVALYAVASGREVGVDVESLRDDFDCAEIANGFFSRREVETLTALPEHSRTRAFFNCWTRKEAYIKARGMGLSLPLDCFDVSLAPGEPAALLATRGGEPDAMDWTLRELEVGPEHVAAVSAEGRGLRLRRWQWP